MALRVPPAMLNMRKRRTPLLRLLFVSLLLGAAANVVIAWTCVACEPDGFAIYKTPTPQDISWWRNLAPSGFADAPYHAASRSFFGTKTIVLVARHSRAPCPEPGDMGVWKRCGWPMYGLEGEVWASQDTRATTPRHIWRPERISPHNYPLMPLPLGFAVNTSLYAAVAFAMLLAARTCSRRARIGRRVRRGLCPACAYPVGTSETCTECGAPVSPRQAAMSGDRTSGAEPTSRDEPRLRENNEPRP